MTIRINAPHSIELEIALDRANKDPDAPQPFCAGKEKYFSLYEESPTQDVAAAMCAPCPLLAICKASARSSHPAWGVQGGISWAKGRYVKENVQIKEESLDT